VARDWRDARRALRAAEAEKTRADNMVRALLGDARYGLDAATGRLFVDRRVYKRGGFVVEPTMVDGLYPMGA